MKVSERRLKSEIDRLNQRSSQAAPPVAAEICSLCEHPKWFHILPAHLRLERDPRSDGHAFHPKVAGQMTLPFGVAKFKPAAAAPRAQMEKKPLSAAKAAKPAKRSVAS